MGNTCATRSVIVLARRVATLWFGTLMLLSAVGCDPNSVARKGSDPEEVFDAQHTPVPVVRPVTVVNEVGGDIVITTGSSGEVALDYNTLGVGADRESAISEAHRNVNTTMTDTADGISIFAQPLRNENDADRVWIHVRVPLQTPLTISTTVGSITVSGAVGPVNANTNNGAIVIRGAAGPLNLTTLNGEIVADGGLDRLGLHAKNGNISIYAVDVHVIADTTVGSIKFIGTLKGHDNLFRTTGNGNIVVALPITTTHTVYASTSSNQIIDEFLPGKGNIEVICGAISDEVKYNYQVNQHDDQIARLELNVITATKYFSGTLADGVYQFQTNSGNLSFFTNVPNALHLDLVSGGQSSQLDGFTNQHFDQKCNGAPNKPAISFTAQTDSGSIYIHGIRTH